MRPTIKKVCAVAVFGWLGFTLACTPNQPLPLPSNPATAVKACPDTPCGADQVCNRAIGGGTCTAPCSDDNACGAIAPGLVCHPAAAGGVCAPDCTATVSGQTGNAICQALDSTLSCNASGRCVPATLTGMSAVRFFLATGNAKSVSISLDQQPLTALNVGNASAYLQVTAGNHVFTFDFGSAGSHDQAVTVSAEKHYTVPIFATTAGSGNFDSQWFDDDTLYAPPGDAGVRYFQACQTIAAQDVLFDLGAGPQPVVGGVSVNTAVDVGYVVAGTGTLEIGESPGSTPAMEGGATLVAGQLYTAITWCGADVPVPTTTLLPPALSTDAPTVYEASGVRLLNASDLAQVILTFDGATLASTTTAGAGTLSPEQDYRLLSPGVHAVHLWRDFAVQGGVPQGNLAAADQTFDFVAGHVYSIIIGGQGEVDPLLPNTILSETLDPAAVPAPKAVARLINYAAADQTDVAQLFFGNQTGIPLGTAAYKGDGGDQLFDTTTPNTLTLVLPTYTTPALTVPQLAFLPQTRYLAIATGTATAVSFWVVGPHGQVAKVP